MGVIHSGGMAQHPPDPTAVAFAVECRKKGMSFEKIAAEFEATGYRVSSKPIAPMTVKRWTDKAERIATAAKPPPRGPKPRPDTAPLVAALAERKAAEQAAPADDEPPPGEEESLLDFMNRQLRTMKADSETARISNPVLYQRLVRDIVTLSNNIGRYEGKMGADGDMLCVPMSEITEGDERDEARMKAMLTRPLLCSDCGAKLSVKWSEGG